MTVQEAVTASTDFLTRKGIPSPRVDAEHLVAHGLGITRLDLYLQYDRRLTDDEQAVLMEATVRTSPQLEVTSRRALFPVPDIVGSNPHSNYGVSPDGKSFVMVMRSRATRIMVIQNLPALVQRLQGASRTP